VGSADIRSVSIEEAAVSLRRGGVGALPTETLYGLAAAATLPEAVARLIELKGREPGKPIALLVDGLPMLRTLVREVTPLAAALANAFWPGPLTLVLDAAEHVDPALSAGTGTIGARVSSCALATRVVVATGAPLTAPSANPAGQAPPRRLDQVWQYFGEQIDFYVDGGDLPGEPASTVVDARDGLRVLRAGAVPTAELEKFVGKRSS